MNFDTQDKVDINNFSHKRTGSKTSLLEVNDNEYKVYSHKRTPSKSSMVDMKYGHSRTGSKSSMTNIIVGKRIGSFSRPVKINDRGSSLPKNNLDPHSHIHKQSHNNLRMPSSEFLIQTRESSLLYNSSNNATGSTITTSNNIPYSSHSRENLKYIYNYSKHSPTNSPRDVTVVYKNVKGSNPTILTTNHFGKNNNKTNHYSPTSATSHSPKYNLPRDNYYQKEGYNKYNFHAAAVSKEKILKSALRNKKMKLWTPNDVLIWLTENNLDNFKEIFKNMKIDGKALMEQNYETLIDIADVSILDKYKIISKRDAVIQYEKENEMIHNNDNNDNDSNNNGNNINNNNNNNPQYTQTLQRYNSNNLFVPATREIDLIKNDVYHNLTKSRSFESLNINKENEGPSNNESITTFTLPRKTTVGRTNFFSPIRNLSGDDKDEFNYNKITSLSRTSSLKMKQLIKDDGLNQKPVIAPRSSSRNIEKAKLRRKGVHEYVYDGKVKTPTSSGSKSTTPLKEKHFMFNYSNSPNSAKEPTFEMTSGYSPIKSADAIGYDDIKLKEEMKLASGSSISPLHSAKSLTNMNSPSSTPIPKFLIKVCNSPQTQSHTIDVTNYNNEIKLWERILTKFDLRLTKENLENHSLYLVKNGQKVPLTATDILNMIKVNESNTIVELVLENNIKPKTMEINRSLIKVRNNKNIHNITESVNKNLSSNIKLTTVPPKDRLKILSNMKPEIRNIKPEIKKEKFRRFFADRPPSQLIFDRLDLFFPEVNQSERIKSMVKENIKEKRLSKLSRLSQSQTHSSYSSYDNQSMIGNVSEEYEDETHADIKKMYFKKSNYQIYSVKTTPINYYQKADIHMEDNQSHDESISSTEPSKKLSIGDKRNSRKLSIITSPDKLKEYKTYKNKILSDIESDYEMTEASSYITNEENEEDRASNDDIYINEITDYSSEISAFELKYIEDNGESGVSNSSSEKIRKYKNNINEIDEDESQNENNGRNKRRGYINIEQENTNAKRNTRSIIRDYERIYYGKNNLSSLKEISESEEYLDNSTSSSSNNKLSIDDAITPKPIDKSINDSRRIHRAIKGISVVSIGGKSLSTMNAKHKLTSPETRFSILLPQKPIQWTRGPLIGQGSFSKVYHGLNTETGEIMAVKQVELCLPISQENDEKNQQMKDALYHEIKLLKELNHQNIVRYLGFELTETSSNVFLEYVSGGSVSSLIAKIGKFEEPLVKSLTSQIAAGMEYLHNCSIIHRDIKGANILVDEDGIAKISDFGISKKTEYEMAYKYNSRMSFQGSIFWMAPEVIRGKGYSAKVDIWSLGCVVLEMFTGVHPWKQYDEIQTVMYNLGMMNKPYIPKRLTPESQNFLNMCLDVNPEKRPTAKQLLAHSFCKPPEIPFDFKEYYQNAIEKVNRFDISTISNDITSMTSNSEITSYDVATELYNEEFITEEEEEVALSSTHDHTTEDPINTEEEEEEEDPINLENIIPKELKLNTLMEESDHELSKEIKEDEENDEDEIKTDKKRKENEKDYSNDYAIENSIDNIDNESLDLSNPTSNSNIDPTATSSSTNTNKIEEKRASRMDVNNKSSSNATFSSFTLSLSLTSTSISSLSSSLSSISSYESNASSDINTLFTTNSNPKSYATSTSNKTIKVEKEGKNNHSLNINTTHNQDKINVNSPSGSSITYKLSNLSLSKTSEESPSRASPSPVLLTPRTPNTPTTPKQHNTK